MTEPMTPAQGRGTRRGWLAFAFLSAALFVALLLDHRIDAWIVATRTEEVWGLAKILSRFLAWHWLMLAAALGIVLAWRQARRDWLRVLCLMAVAASVAGLTADILRGTIGRTRPSAPVTQGWYGPRENRQWLIGEHAYNSFPSGHTTTATAFALPLFLWRRRLGYVAFPFIAVVASARVWASAHHVSDVIAGALLGSAIALVLWRWTGGGERLLTRWRRERV